MNLFKIELTSQGVLLTFNKRSHKFFSTEDKPLDVSEWASNGDKDLLRGLAAISPILQGMDNSEVDHVVLPFDFVAALSDREARVLSLPVSIPYQLRVWGSGNWVDDSYDLNTEFLDGGQAVFIDARIGSIIEIGRIRYRLPDPIYSIICEVANINVSDSRDKKIEAQSKIAEILGSAKIGSSRLSPDEQIANIKIRHVAGFSAAVTGSLEDPELSPVLFSKKVIESQLDRDLLLDENQQILDLKQASSFCDQFKKSKKALSTYVLGSGEYVYIDPSVRSTLTAFCEISNSDPETKIAFLKSPRVILSSMTGDEYEDEEDRIADSFIETSQFSDRVIGINKWSVPVLPWLATESNEWGTNTLIFEQSGSASPVVIAKETLGSAIKAVEEGLLQGSKNVNIGGVEIPVSQSLLSSMKEFMPTDPDSIDSKIDDNEELVDSPVGPFVVETIDGFEAVNYVKNLIPPKYSLIYQTPRVLVPATSLMPHQEYGLRWLISSYNVGLPGVLVADDMGLGKTLQALVFLAIYREQVPKTNQKPCLIVAPTGLLNNWQKEISEHLGNNGLGELTLAYGAQLKNLKTEKSGRDTDLGVAMLDISKIQSSGVLLTTYESLRDYQISFSQVSFGVVVFDEIQKTKNPRSLLSRAAAAINGKFQIGLSGTPVENSLADLWTILDILAPGLIKYSLLEFMNKYSGSTDDPDVIKRLTCLQSELLHPDDERIPPVLRRMKSEVFKDGGLPKKIIHAAEVTCKLMPPEQESAYRLEVERVQKGEIKMVQGLQRFKRISMSPKSYLSWLDDPEHYIEESARLSQFIEILDEVKNRSEKALVFVESLELQPILAQVLKERYSLEKLPLIINGKISGKERQRCVDQFQEEQPGFNLMLISPKAGGVGLTLTAANNVIHLERWWNPAVEDQCNDRAYRIGQKKDVNIYTPVAKHRLDAIPSFDLVLDSILTRKRVLAESIFMPSELSSDDFSNFFQEKSSSSTDRVFSPISLPESYSLGTGEEFEDYVGNALFSSGFIVSKTKKSWDFGCDLIAKKESQVVLCQVKQVMSDKTLADGVDEIIESRERYQSQRPTALALITNAKRITRTQIALAARHNVYVLLGNSIENYGEGLCVHLNTQGKS